MNNFKMNKNKILDKMLKIKKVEMVIKVKVKNMDRKVERKIDYLIKFIFIPSQKTEYHISINN